MNKTQKIIIIGSLILLITIIILNSIFIFSKLKEISIVNPKLSFNNYANTTYKNYENTTNDPSITNGGTVSLTDVYSPIKISFNYTLDETTINNANVKLYTSNKKSVPIKINLEDTKNGFIVTPLSGNFMDDSIYKLVIKKELSGLDGNLLLKDVEYTIEIKKLYLGADLFLTDKYNFIFKNKTIGLITNQTGIDSLGERTQDKIYKSNNMRLGAIFAPEHGLYGNETSTNYIDSYLEKSHGIRVYNLYSNTSSITAQMTENIDVLVYDIQDSGIRCDSYLNTLYKSLEGAKINNKPIFILDRPNPLGGEKIQGPLLEEDFKSSVGVDILPLSHGMTIGEIAKYFNRNINCDLTVIPMIGWFRNMTFNDCGLDFEPIYPDMVDLNSIYLYGATNIFQGTNLKMADNYHGIFVENVDLNEVCQKMNQANLNGVNFLVEKDSNKKDFIKIDIINYNKFDPILTGIYLLANSRIIAQDRFNIPISNPKYSEKVLFEKLMGTDKVGKLLSEYKIPEEIVMSFQSQIDEFNILRQKYLIYK